MKPAWRYAVVALAIVCAAAAVEYAMGRVPWCTCGYIKVWHGVVNSSENSQHITDWYTPSHVVHGVLFYFLLWLVARRLPPGVRFVIAVLLEAAWEVVENTPLVINRYRAATIALDYYGDSIVNSMSDIAAMMVGFWIARKAPAWLSIALVVALELTVGAIIRDNLTLNIIMLIHPIEAIKRWQLRGGQILILCIPPVCLAIGASHAKNPPSGFRSDGSFLHRGSWSRGRNRMHKIKI